MSSSTINLPKPKRVLVCLSTYMAHSRAILKGLLRYTRNHEPWEILFEHRPRTSAETIRKGPHVDGIISEVRNEQIADALAESDPPAVGIGGQWHRPGVGWVLADNHAVGRMAADYFLSLGYRQFGVCSTDQQISHVQRREAFLAVLSERDLVVRECLRSKPGKSEWHAEAPELVAWSCDLPKPIAVFCCNDDRARQLSVACRESGVRVPDQLAILGVNNDELICGLSFPPLSSIDHNCNRIGYEAAVMLDAMMQGQGPPDRPLTVEPLELVQRQSTETLAVDDPSVAAAVSWIRRHATEEITVEDVAAAVTSSRRVLEMAFRKHLDSGVYQEILRVRIQHAKRLLVRTQMPMPEITDACGFGYPSQFSSLFKRHVGMPPSAYRKRNSRGIDPADLRSI